MYLFGSLGYIENHEKSFIKAEVLCSYVVEMSHGGDGVSTMAKIDGFLYLQTWLAI